MSNGTTNVDQANFHVMSTNRQNNEFEVVMSGKFPDNIDPKALGYIFDRDGAINVKKENNGVKEKIALIRKGLLKEDNKDNREDVSDGITH